jgi:hypothetical protein
LTADRYQQAKTIFVRLLEASDTERKLQLERLRAESPELEQEVRSLLDYHTAESLIAAPVAPRIRTRSTLSTTYHLRSLDWLQGPLRCALMTIPLGIVAAIMGLWFDAHIQRQLKSSLAHHLSEAVDYRLIEFRLWE